MGVEKVQGFWGPEPRLSGPSRRKETLRRGSSSSLSRLDRMSSHRHCCPCVGMIAPLLLALIWSLSPVFSYLCSFCTVPRSLNICLGETRQVLSSSLMPVLRRLLPFSPPEHRSLSPALPQPAGPPSPRRCHSLCPGQPDDPSWSNPCLPACLLGSR